MRTGRPNRLEELEDGVRQANMLADIGFSQVYLYVVVVADTRKETMGQDVWAGLTSELRELIYRRVSALVLFKRIGIFRHDFIQTKDYEPFEVGSRQHHLLKPATALEQKHDLSHWVAAAMALREKS